MTQLWHYTCAHSRAELGREGELLPTADRVDVTELGLDAWPTFFVWLTDLARPHAAALGLTRRVIRCDRTAYRYRVTGGRAIPWQKLLEAEPGYRSVAGLLDSPGADPAHWWVSRHPVPVVFDPIVDGFTSDLDRVSAIVRSRWSR